MECFVCGIFAKDGEVFIETEDGFMCPDCAGDIENIEDIPYNNNNEEDLNTDDFEKDPDEKSYNDWKI